MAGSPTYVAGLVEFSALMNICAISLYQIARGGRSKLQNRLANARDMAGDRSSCAQTERLWQLRLFS